MVKVHAPAMSMEASGKLGNALVFARWKGRAYARSLVKPHNPKLPSQIGIRTMMRFLSQFWKTLTAEDQATWADLAKATNISPFNAYIAYNMRRWREAKPPTQAYPASEESDADTVDTFQATGGPRNIDIAVCATTWATAWGIVLCRSQTTGFTPSWANCIRIITLPTTGPKHWIDAPLAAGTYYYRAAVINKDGVIGAYKAQINASAT